MKFSFFSPKVSKADQDREAQQELEAALSRAQPPTEAQRTWVIPVQEVPEWARPQPPRRGAPRRPTRPLIPPSGPSPAAQGDFDDVPFEDEEPLDQVPLNRIFEEPQRPTAPRPAAPRKKPAAATGNASAAPKAARPKPAPASGSGDAPRPRSPQKRTPPPRRRPPQ